MIHTKQLQTLLQHHYDRSTWNQILESIFASVHFLRDPAPLPITNPHITAFHQTGVVRLSDGKSIALFEVVLDENIHLLRNRVGVRNLMTRFINEVDNHGVLVVYDQGNANYRLTFVARESGFNEQGEWAVFETASKRFTYVLGSGETCRTAAERLALLAAKKDSAGMNDVIDAFSVERLSKEFFTRYKSHYQAFVDYLAASNYRKVAFRGDDKAIRDFVKKLLGRIVFLHFLQKKGWMGATDEAYTTGDRHFMQHFWESSGKGETFYTQHLTRLFFDALNTQHREHDAFQMPDDSVVKIPYLNGGLFDKDRHEPEWLTFPPELFDALFAFFGEYNFTIDENDPEEREVGIDPEMLGHIFENLLEDNKDKGAFYTPKEIVQYMTQESLIEYLRTGLERHGVLSENEHKALRYFIRYKLKGDELPQEELQGDLAQFFQTQLAFIQRFGATLNRLLDDVKICDPAIGSGAFPMGLLNEMYHCKVLLNNTYTPEERAAIKRHIIENSIYGVDIEKGAVDIARLRFWLSLIVDEDTPTPLPNLDYKIVAGDSLVSKFDNQIIDIDWNDDTKNTVQFGLLGSQEDKLVRQLLQRITEKQQAFFHANTAEKVTLARGIRQLKIDLLISQLEAMVKNHGEEQEPKGKGKAAKKQMERFLKTQGWKQTITKLHRLKEQPEQPFNHFDWTLDFPEVLNTTIAGENPGFDIVIGNPPYVQLQKSGGTLAKLYQDAGFSTFARTGDIYCLFYEKGHEIIKEGGNLCFITSNKWMRAGYGKATREFFMAHTLPKILIDFGDAPLFANATTYTNILLFEKRSGPPNHCQVFDLSRETRLEEKLSPYLDTLKGRYRAEFVEERYLIVSDTEFRIKKKVEKAGIPLKDWNIAIYRGILTGYNEAFIIDGAKRAELIAADPKSEEILKPILRGKDIKRYQVNFQDLWLINSHNGIKEKGIPPIEIPQNFPAIYEHLRAFQLKCEKRADQGDHWTNLRNCAYIEDFEKEKVMWLEMAQKASFLMDTNGLFCLDTARIMTGEDIKYLTAMLNSKLLNFAFSAFYAGGNLQGNTIRFKSVFLENLPIVKTDDVTQRRLESFVERIQQAKKQHEDTTALEEQVDLIVYKLYDLTYDEVLVVDSNFELNKEEYSRTIIAEIS